MEPIRGAPPRPTKRPKPPPKPPTHPQARALYDYEASDTDEISLVAGQKLSILKEGNIELSGLKQCLRIIYIILHSIVFKWYLLLIFKPFLDESGWWTGKLPNGAEGFFPGAYVQKL